MVERVMTLSRGLSLSAKGVAKALETVIEDGIRHLKDAYRFGHGETGPVQQQTVLLCAELRMPRQVWGDAGLACPESALDGFLDGVTRTYWRTRDSAERRLALGSIMAVESHGNNRWKSLRERWEQEHQAITQVVCAHGDLERSESADGLILNQVPVDTGVVADIPWYGGGAFADETPAGPWTGWPAALFYVPLYELIEDDAVVRLRVRMLLPVGRDHPDTTGTLDVLQRFFNWFDASNQPSSMRADELENIAEGDGAEEPDLLTQIWYQDAVARAAMEIRQGTYHKLVLARHKTVAGVRPYQPSRVVRQLSLDYSDSFVFACCWNSSCFVGASPERLVRVRRHVANVDCLAGTTARAASESEDSRLADELMRSAKDRQEHQVVLEWIENRLSGFSSHIAHPAEPQIRKLANVQHLHTPMEAALGPGVTIFDLASELHPTPAVAGTPRDNATRLIRQREPVDRGWYAGCLGVIQGDGDGEMCVAIRSALIVGSTAILYAGAGIMGDSNPVSEWRETELKLRPMQDALATSARGYSLSQQRDFGLQTGQLGNGSVEEER